MDEEAIAAAVARFEDVIKNGDGEVIKTDHLGKRRLAFEINDKFDGYYILMNFKSPSAAAQELERLMRIHDDVIRQLVVKKEE